jgi:hypothetical protein
LVYLLVCVQTRQIRKEGTVRGDGIICKIGIIQEYNSAVVFRRVGLCCRDEGNKGVHKSL